MTTKAFYYTVALAIAWLLARLLRSAKQRQVLFLLVSYGLYAMWGWWFLGVLILSSVVNYGLGELVRRRPAPGRLWLGILFNVALLATFKYLPGFAAASQSHAAAGIATLALPIGISFWTFQALSYLFDLYREEELDPSVLEFCLYMAFWPTVLSGPICRMPTMLPQFRAMSEPNADDLRTGADRVFLGLFMMAIAQMLGAGVKAGEGINAAFDSARAAGGADAWILAVGYGFQLFFDFAGYSHLVIGAARLFGFQLPENFARPYLSTTPSVFWTRWHISLSFWIRDYLFLPLAMARREPWWRNIALVLSMVIFGLWHKGTLLFLIWGTYQGLLLVAHRQLSRLRQHAELRMPGPIDAVLSWAVTFAAISFGWLLFRANDWTQARSLIAAVLSPASYGAVSLPASLCILVGVVFAGYFLVAAADVALEGRTRAIGARLPLQLRFAVYALMFYVGVLHASQPQSFIYLQF